MGLNGTSCATGPVGSPHPKLVTVRLPDKRRAVVPEQLHNGRVERGGKFGQHGGGARRRHARGTDVVLNGDSIVAQGTARGSWGRRCYVHKRVDVGVGMLKKAGGCIVVSARTWCTSS